MRQRNLAIISLMALLSGCGIASDKNLLAQTGPDASSQNVPPVAPQKSEAATESKAPVDDSDVQTIQSGKTIQISPNVEVEADDKTPNLVLGAKSAKSRDLLELSKEITVWDCGTETRIEVLGKLNDDSEIGSSYALRIKSKKAPPPAIANSARGPFGWSYNDPSSLRDHLNFKTVSHNPLLMVGADGRSNLQVVTNYGSAKVSDQALRPKAVYFKKDSGATITAQWNDKLGDYDIPKADRGHGSIRGSAPGTSSTEVSIGPARVTISREYPPSSRSTQVSIDITNQNKYTGPIVIDYKLLDFYSASMGMKTYVPPSTMPLASLKRYDKPDQNFEEYWNLKLDPPILVEDGLGARGVLTGPAKLKCTLWKFGDRVFGAGDYKFSDTNSHGGGLVEGVIKDGAITLKVKGAPNISMTSTSMTPKLIKGTAKVYGNIPGGSYAKQPANEGRTFTLEAVELDANAESAKLIANIGSIPPNVEYWNALAATPGDGRSATVITDTLRLIEAEKLSGSNPYEVNDHVSALAHTHYVAWLSSANDRGVNHPITVAHEQIAEKLYRRLLDSEVKSRLRSHDSSMERLVKMLRDTNRGEDADAIEKQLADEKQNAKHDSAN